jgi:hypothetical protein
LSEDDELRQVSPRATGTLSAEEFDKVFPKDLAEVVNYRIKDDGDTHIHTVDFGRGSTLTIVYSLKGNRVWVEYTNVRIEQNRERILVSRPVD